MQVTLIEFDKFSTEKYISSCDGNASLIAIYETYMHSCDGGQFQNFIWFSVGWRSPEI